MQVRTCVNAQQVEVLYTPYFMPLHPSGCVKLMHEVDSRSFGAVMRGCRHRCDFHQVLQEAEDRYRRSRQLERASHTAAHAHINTHTEETESREWDRCKRLALHGLSQ